MVRHQTNTRVSHQVSEFQSMFLLHFRHHMYIPRCSIVGFSQFSVYRCANYTLLTRTMCGSHIKHIVHSRILCFSRSHIMLCKFAVSCTFYFTFSLADVCTRYLSAFTIESVLRLLYTAAQLLCTVSVLLHSDSN